MIRITSVPPGVVNMPKLTEEAQGVWPRLLTVNQLEGPPMRVAFYFNDEDAPTQAWVDALVLAHDPTTASGADRAQVIAFMNAASGTATPVQRDDTTKAVIRYLRRSGAAA
jgi:hypothetical protein